MKSVLQHYIKLALLKAEPQDMPASNVLQAILIFLYIIFAVINTSSMYQIWQGLLHGVIDIMLLALFAYIIVRSNKARFNQTLNAFLGVSLVVGLVHAVSTLFIPMGPQVHEIPELAQIIFFIIFIWVIVVYGHIIRYAADVGMAVATTISLFYIILNVMILVSLSGLLKA